MKLVSNISSYEEDKSSSHSDHSTSLPHWSLSFFSSSFLDSIFQPIPNDLPRRRKFHVYGANSLRAAKCIQQSPQ